MSQDRITFDKFKHTCRSCKLKQECPDAVLLNVCGKYSFRGNRAKGSNGGKPMGAITEDIGKLPSKMFVEKCKDTDCRYFRATGCIDNCARGEYGNPDCHYEFLTEDEAKNKGQKKLAKALDKILELECQEFECEYFSPRSASEDNCGLAAFGDPECILNKKIIVKSIASGQSELKADKIPKPGSDAQETTGKRKYKITCRSCNKYKKPECIARYGRYETDGLGIRATCDNYKRSGGRNTEKPKCDRTDCVYYMKSSKSWDNCSIAGFANDKCDYNQRSHTKMGPKASEPENIIESMPGQKPLPYAVMLTHEPTLSELVKILQAFLTDTGLEIVIRPSSK